MDDLDTKKAALDEIRKLLRDQMGDRMSKLAPGDAVTITVAKKGDAEPVDLKSVLGADDDVEESDDDDAEPEPDEDEKAPPKKKPAKPFALAGLLKLNRK